MAFALPVRIDVLRSLGFASISTTYTKVGTPLDHRMRTLKFTNNTDGDLLIAITNGSVPLSNGTEDNEIVPAGGFVLYDYSANGGESTASPFCFEIGTQVWVRYSTAPTQKAVYVSAQYGKGE